MSELLDPVLSCRASTIALFTYWSVRGWVRAIRFVKRLEETASASGLAPGQVRQQVKRVALCATIGDALIVLLLWFVAWLWWAPKL